MPPVAGFAAELRRAVSHEMPSKAIETEFELLHHCLRLLGAKLLVAITLRDGVRTIAFSHLTTRVLFHWAIKVKGCVMPPVAGCAAERRLAVSHEMTSKAIEAEFELLDHCHPLLGAQLFVAITLRDGVRTIAVSHLTTRALFH